MIAKGMERLVTKAMNKKEVFPDEKPNVLIICPPPIRAVFSQISK